MRWDDSALPAATTGINGPAWGRCPQSLFVSRQVYAETTANYLETHLRIGIDSLKQLINQGHTVKHLIF